jgi:hypothetical protein
MCILQIISSNWEVITAISSGTLAILALGATFYQAHLTRHHNLISVTPKLTTWKTIRTESGNMLLALRVKNSGIGPAEITSFEIFIDQRKIAGEQTEPIEKAASLLFPNTKYNAEHAFVAAGYCLAAGDEFNLIKLTFIKDHEPTPVQLQSFEDRARLVIKYRSMYKVEECLDTDKFKSKATA